MKLPIQYALTFPDRFPMNGERLSFPKLQSMTFSEPDRNKFRCLQLAYDALSRGGTLPAAMNAANEVAVEAFLTKRITFKRIPEVIENAMTTHKTISSPELPDIIEADRLTRQHAETLI